MTALATIGYEGASLLDFIATLRLAGVEQVIDIREIPQSRRPGFSKTVLSEALDRFGISYIHLKALGDPKSGRDAARAGRYDEFRKIFHAHIGLPAGTEALVRAAEVAASTSSVLLCFERNPRNCHRSIVAERLSALYPFCVRHLGVVDGAATAGVRGKRQPERV